MFKKSKQFYFHLNTLEDGQGKSVIVGEATGKQAQIVAGNPEGFLCQL